MAILEQSVACTHRLGSRPADLTCAMEDIRDWLSQSQIDHRQRHGVLMAIGEAVHNAIEHGCLELDSELRESPDWARLIEMRRRTEPWCSREVEIHVDVRPHQIKVVVRDGGNGCTPARRASRPSCRQLTHGGGRGLLMIQSVMDVVSFNSTGNEITMVKNL